MRPSATKLLYALLYANFHVAVAWALLRDGYRLYHIFTNWDHYQHLWQGMPKLEVASIGGPLLVICFSVFIWIGIFIRGNPRAATFAGLFGFALLLGFGLVGAVLVLVGNSLYERPVFFMHWLRIYLGGSMLLFAAAYLDRNSSS